MLDVVVNSAMNRFHNLFDDRASIAEKFLEDRSLGFCVRIRFNRLCDDRGFRRISISANFSMVRVKR